VKYFLDEDISPKIAERLRAARVDAVSSHECGRNGLDDAEQLRLAALEGRCFVTRNRDDYVALTVQAFQDLAPHAGILILPSSVPGNRFALVARALIQYALKHPKGMQPYTVDFASQL